MEPADETHNDNSFKESSVKKEMFFMPHHAVFKPESSTTKTRVVFDASAKSSTGISLNDTLMTGPVVQQDLLSIVTRFRTHPYVLTADISKMYRQVRIHQHDYDLQKILWRSSPHEDLKQYHLVTVTYGTSPASFLATRCLAQLAIDEEENHPNASQVLKRDFYVDDLLTGCSTIEETIQLQEELQILLERGGFELRKWCSNNDTILEAIQSSHQTSKESLTFDKRDHVRALGLSWNLTHDKFLFDVHVKPSPTM